jgi:hypothetical protein
MVEKCSLCETRKPRRRCPAVRGEICAQCCGTEREVTIDCPFDCENLREARRREKLVPVEPDKFPNPDIPVSESFLREHEALLGLVGRGVLTAAVQTPGAVDEDVREALGSLVRTYRTLQSGLVYETLPSGGVASVIHGRVQQAINELRQQVTQSSGAASMFRDSEVLGILVFLERLAIDRNNGRRRGKVFLDFLRGHFPLEPERQETKSPLIL